jgi:hypothetical protein
MSWPPGTHFYNFNKFSISLNAPPQYGVYAIFDSKRKALLVDAGDVMVDLVRLVYSEDPQLFELQPTHFSFVLVDFAEARKMRRQLIAELAPPCNQQPKAMAHAAGM